VKPSITIACLTLAAFQLKAADWVVSMNGNSGNPGTLSAPWEINYSFNGGAGGAIHPGDTVWIRGGTYSATGDTNYWGLWGYGFPSGTPSSPIIYRNYNNERVILDGGMNLTEYYTNVWFWGLEFTDNDPPIDVTLHRDSGFPAQNDYLGNYSLSISNFGIPLKLSGVSLNGDGDNLINCIVHDNYASSVMGEHGSQSAHYYGTLFLYNGRNAIDLSSGNGLYNQSDLGHSSVSNCIVYGAFLNGSQLYSASADVPLWNFTYANTIFYQNGFGRPLQQNFVCGSNVGVSNLLFAGNVLYSLYTTGYAGESADFGWGGSPFINSTISGNYFYQVTPLIEHSSGISFVSNYVDVPTLSGPALRVNHDDNLTVGTWDYNSYFNNYQSGLMVETNYALVSIAAFADWKSFTGKESHSTWSATAGTSPVVHVFTNAYERGRGHIAILNPGNSNNVDVDLSGLGLQSGQRYVIHSIQDYFGLAITNTYTSAVVSIPMNDWPVHQPRSLEMCATNATWQAANPGYATGLGSTLPTFGAFVVVPMAASQQSGIISANVNTLNVINWRSP
jgi:hypothetical protein